MATVPNFYLIDSSGQVWLLGATGVGAYSTTAVTGPTGQPYFVLTDVVTELPMLLTVATSGALQTASTTIQTAQQNIPVIATSGALMGIIIFNGAVSVMRLTYLCETGILYEQNRKYLPTFTQPGGQGTSVFPAQQTGELVGRFIAGCGHAFEAWTIYSDSCNGVQSAFLCCPVCNFIQQIFTPYNLIHQFPNEIIMG